MSCDRTGKKYCTFFQEHGILYHHGSSHSGVELYFRRKAPEGAHLIERRHTKDMGRAARDQAAGR